MTNKVVLYAQYQGPSGYYAEKERFSQFEKANILKIGQYYKVKKFRTIETATKVVLEQIDECLNCSAFDFYNVTFNQQNKPIKKEKYDIVNKTAQQDIVK